MEQDRREFQSEFPLSLNPSWIYKSMALISRWTFVEKESGLDGEETGESRPEFKEKSRFIKANPLSFSIKFFCIKFLNFKAAFLYSCP